MSNITEPELAIAQLILSQGIVHYTDIAKTTGFSKKTIAKYLSQLADSVKAYGVHLIRKRNVGLFFEGDLTALRNAVSDHTSNGDGVSRDQRVIALLSRLLLSQQPIPIQNLADGLFVSRSTFEADLNEVKLIVQRHQAAIASNHQGIFIQAAEANRRALMSELLNLYWGQTAYLDDRQDRVKSTIQVPDNISQLFNSDTLEKVISAVDQFEQISSLRFSDYEYQSLTIHLVIALERIKHDEVLKSESGNDSLYKDTKLLVSILEKEFKIKIPFDEQRYINIHIMAAQDAQGRISIQSSGKGSQTQTVMDAFLRDNLSEYDSILIKNLALHLIPALKRLELGLELRNPYTEEVKRNFPLAYNRAVDLGVRIKQEFNTDVSDDELAFIALHIEAFIERSRQVINAVIICSTGLGTARLLEQRVKNRFANKIRINRVTSLQELKEHPITEDLVISTINIQVPGKAVIVVSPFLDEAGAQQISRQINDLEADRPDPAAFNDLLKSSLVFIKRELNKRDNIIRFLGNELVQQGFGAQGIAEAAIGREKLASTAMDMVAMPHAPIDFVKRPCIAIFINRDGISWNQNSVEIVFFLAMNTSVKTQINDIYKYFNNVLENKYLLKQLVHANAVDEVIKLLGGNRA
ncbi:BglG family transcription antiterminator [Lacticaseibacillus chiayiensis]|uniref:BglG family transcription antiterminator n=1 Tax=Lacticaseibacillus chiayiensis TaxID=2100821 RepID=UPI003C75C478